MDAPQFPHESVYSALVTPANTTESRARPIPAWWEASVMIVTALATATCVVLLYAFIPPAAMIFLLGGAFWALVILGAVWLILTVIGWVRYRAWKLSSIAVLIVAATGVLVVLSVPSRAAFAVSEGALSEIATDCRSTGGGGRAGAYELKEVRAVDGGCLIYVEGGFLDQVGFAHLPDGAPDLGSPAGDQQIGYVQVHGNWYTFVHQF